jgi:hypothetical protein
VIEVWHRTTNDPPRDPPVNPHHDCKEPAKEASMRTDRAPGPLARLARRHGLARSPLRRTIDRIEGAVIVVLAVPPQRARRRPAATPRAGE